MLRTQAKLGASCGVRVVPFGSSFCGARRFAKAAGAHTEAKWTMKGSFLVEIEVGEVEPEDLAIQRYQRAVTNTLVLSELRRRRRVMTKIEAIQAKQNELGLVKKLNVDPPRWKDQYGESTDPAPFADFFSGDSLEYAEIVNGVNLADDMFFDAIAQSDSSGGYGQNTYGNSAASGYMVGGNYSGYSGFGGYGSQPGGQGGYSQSGGFGQGTYGSQGNFDQGGYNVGGTPQTDYAAPQMDYGSSPQNQRAFGSDAPSTY